jgi:uncharacterized protein (DUF952 family)
VSEQSSGDRRVIFHIALERDWNAANQDGAYRVSTRDATLEEVGFIHASFEHQVAGVGSSFYRDACEPLVVLTIEPDRLEARVVVESPDGGGEAFPHIYGPLPTSAVIAVRSATVTDDGRFLVEGIDDA